MVGGEQEGWGGYKGRTTWGDVGGEVIDGEVYMGICMWGDIGV